MPPRVRVLVTGNLGYIGPRLVDRLLAAGHVVIGVDAGWYTSALAEPVVRPETQYLADLRDLVRPAQGDQLREMLEGVDAVVHLAAVSNDPVADLLPSITHEINLDMSVAFARAARAAGVRRFVFLSTCSVYGDADGEVDESTPPRVLTPYADTKVRFEEALMRLAAPGFEPVILRSATVYGYSPALRLDLMVNGMTAWALTTGIVRLISTGEANRPQVHVDDLVGLISGLLSRDTADFGALAGMPINVGSNQANYTIRELAELVAARVPGAEVRVDDGAWVDKRSYRVRFDRMARLLPGTRIRSVEDSVAALAGEYRRIALAGRDVRALRYTRLGHLRHARERGIIDEQLRFISPSETEAGPVAAG